MNLKDKIAVVTGGSSGIGQAICIALSKEGCKVVFTYNSNEKGADETLKELGEDSFKFKVDLQNEEEIKGLFNFVKEKFGKLDILVNDAGVEVLSDDPLDLSTWKKTFEADLYWAVACTKYAVKVIGESGRILNISSEYADEWMGYKDSIAYSAAKAALNNFTKTIAKSLAPKINVNAISPGYVDTPMWKHTTSDQKRIFGKDQLIERFIKPEEIADMAVAIIKNDAMTGEVVVVDGGLSLKTV